VPPTKPLKASRPVTQYGVEEHRIGARQISSQRLLFFMTPLHSQVIALGCACKVKKQKVEAMTQLSHSETIFYLEVAIDHMEMGREAKARNSVRMARQALCNPVLAMDDVDINRDLIDLLDQLSCGIRQSSIDVAEDIIMEIQIRIEQDVKKNLL